LPLGDVHDMKITLFYESGEIAEIGTGHKYRCLEIAKLLEKNGHDVRFMLDGVLTSGRDVLVIDHIKSQKSLIARAKHSGMKVVLIDGHPDDTELVDLSISAFVNPKAEYTGVKYMAFPVLNQHWDKYRAGAKSNAVFVGVGGFDYRQMAEVIVSVLQDMELNAVVAKSLNHTDFREKFSRVVVFEEENYYSAMKECVLSITNGGLTLFQSLYYGMPTLPIAQYKHQETNISFVDHCCVPTKLDKAEIKDKVIQLVDNEYQRESLSRLAKYFVDGKGTKRICSLIEKV